MQVGIGILVLGPFPVNRRQDNKEREREERREDEVESIFGIIFCGAGSSQSAGA